MTDITTKLPEMKSGDKLIAALAVMPQYDENICGQNHAVRLNGFVGFISDICSFTDES